MANLNKVMLIGNLTRDPELRVTPKGTAVCSFGMAINRQYRDESGATHEDTTFVDIEAWGRQGELCSKYLTKGSPLFVEGRLRLDSWESKAGEKRSKLKVVLENMQFLSRAGGESGGSSSDYDSGSSERPAAPARSAARSQEQPPADDLDEDVPF